MTPATDRGSPASAGGCGCAGPDGTAADTCYCTVDELVGAISRKHALSVVNFLGDRAPSRFCELEEGLGGLSSSTLSDTLSDLVDVGLVSREVFPEAPPRVEYRLTEAGRLLRRRLRRLLQRIQEMPDGP